MMEVILCLVLKKIDMDKAREEMLMKKYETTV